ncbi:MAG: hypothetical protein HYT75_07960 [Deltaproteobacteria bacterium]|nr:hypothetical protein [Deltaproteobacteria bacterium]MBI2341648.1 hypothetical protein [Deltaproteobacteria bacterium]
MAKIKICKEEGCHNEQTTGGYCRLHYLRNWKTIKKEQQEKAVKRLNRYIEAICRKHPTKYVEVIKEEINSKKIRRDDAYSEVDDLYHLFNEPSYDEEIERLIKELKIEKEF